MKKYFLICITLLISLPLLAKEEVISKIFNASDISLLVIDNKFGEIKVVTWDEPTIAVDVIIRATSSKTETVEKIFSNVDVDFHRSENSIVLRTLYGSFFSFIKMSNNLFRGGEFSIDYVVKAPNNIDLKINLKSGNLILFERTGYCEVEHTDGYFSAQALHGNADFKLRGSQVKISSVHNLKLDMKSGTMQLDKARSIKGDIYNTALNIGTVGALDLKSLKDEIEVKSAQVASINATISKVRIHALGEGGVISTDYGSLVLADINKSFDNLKISGRGTKMSISIGKTPANVTIYHHQSTDIDIPDSMGLQMKFGETNKEFITIGTLGKPSRANQLMINSRGGSLTLR